MKKKYAALLLAILLLCALCALCACGGQEAPQEDAGEPDAQTETVPGQIPEDEVAPGEPEDADVPEDGEEDPAAGDKETPKEGEDAPEAGKPEDAVQASAEKPEAPAGVQGEVNEPAKPSVQNDPKPAEKPASSEKPPEKPVEKPAETEKPAEAPPAPAPAPEEKPAETETPTADPKTVAQGLVGRPVSELYAAIGRPISSDYAPSCLVENGEDGELVYDGFIVYTEKGPGYETVYAVM